MLKVLINGRAFCSRSNKVITKMKYLNVAEKNDAAKNIANQLSNGTSQRSEGLSKFNKIYKFTANVQGRQADMIMTSVSGHLMTRDYPIAYSNWSAVDPLSLFTAPVIKICPQNFLPIKKTLEREIRSCHGLIIWTDCDREGENIGYEIIDVCRAIKPNIEVHRAVFSEITSQAVKRALANLQQPDLRKSQAVDVRSELDLRIGAAFTRYQTMRYQRLFPTLIEKNLVSYGSCQIPTLGFVTERYKENENFIPQPFWKLISGCLAMSGVPSRLNFDFILFLVNHTIDALTVDYSWGRNRLFDKQCCEAFLMVCQGNPTATVTSVVKKPKNKWRPTPMDTIELEKLGSKKLKISAKQTMTIAEKLYQQGFISYPRTETNIFSPDVNLVSLVEQHVPDPNYGAFATKVLQWGPNPRQGRKSDQAHPPIHPTKYTNGLSGNEARVYELIVRHFLACVSRDAVGSETIVNAQIVDEEFTATGLIIHERNYLEVYIYDKWTGKEVHPYQQGEQFNPTELSMREGTTTAPPMLTEAELIALMDKHGIGTDATHAEHINTIKERLYIAENERRFLIPGTLGMGLVEGYESIEIPLAKPQLRANLEKDLQLICDGRKQPDDVLREQIRIHKEVFEKILAGISAMDATLANRLQETPVNVPAPQATTQFHEVHKCPRCSAMIALKTVNDGRIMLTCLGFPACKQSMWLPQDYFKDAVITDDVCENCGPGYKKIRLKLKGMHLLSFLNANNVEGLSYKTCPACDRSLKDLCGQENDRQTSSSSRQGNTTTVADSPRNNGNYINPNARNYRGASNTPRTSANQTSVLSNDSASRPSGNGTANGNNTRNRGDGNTSRRPPSNSNDSEVKCPICGKVLTPLTSKTPANPGRQFYKCCENYFKWADEIAAPSTRTTQGSSTGAGANRTNAGNRNTNQPPPSSGVTCTKCGRPGNLKQVTRDTVNKGRYFYNCSECADFFKWADEVDGSTTRGAYWRCYSKWAE
ncbi:hypothetical protein HA402_004813 [Bradysia odoriphaga]|nr:hypothetical protein HA402_004813 [Bradysia odoriphaga]